VLFLLNQPQSALQTELNGFFQQVTDAALESCHVTASAFCKARQKLDPAVFEALNQAIQAQLDAQGLRLLAIDGSMVRVDPHLRLQWYGGRIGTSQARGNTRRSTHNFSRSPGRSYGKKPEKQKMLP